MKNIKNIIEQKNPPEDPNVLWLKDNTLYKSTSKGWVPLNESPSITEHYEDHKSTLTYTGSDGKEHAVITDDSFTPNNDGDIIITDSNNEEHTIVTEENLNEILSNGTVVPITWQELKDKRDNGELIPGSLYRITDYNCTTTQENTRSAGHQFDIVLLALSENKLAEEGWAMEHPTDVYEVTFSDGITKKCLIYKKTKISTYANVVAKDTMLGIEDVSLVETITINYSTKTATSILNSTDLNTPNIEYNYFYKSNLSAWKVWYCLDNDMARFAWADGIPFIEDDNEGYRFYRSQDNDEDGYYAWYTSDDDIMVYTQSPTPSIGDAIYAKEGGDFVDFEGGDIILFAEVFGAGRGVIYRLIDEFNNDIKYDFKNIQFKRTITNTNGQYDENGIETWCYTLNVWYDDMCQDASIVGNTLLDDEGYIEGVYGNKFGYTTAYDLYLKGVSHFAFALGNNVVLSSVDGGGSYFGIYSNTIGNTSYSNTIGGTFKCNTIGNDFQNNTIVDTFSSNTIGNGFKGSRFDVALTYANYGNNGVELATKDDLN